MHEAMLTGLALLFASASALAAPSTSPAPQCPRDATVVTAAGATPSPLPQYPGEIDVVVEVTVAPDGSVQATKITQSSENPTMDDAATRAARQSKYLPKLIVGNANACKAVAGTYSFKVTFVPDH